MADDWLGFNCLKGEILMVVKRILLFYGLLALATLACGQGRVRESLQGNGNEEVVTPLVGVTQIVPPTPTLAAGLTEAQSRYPFLGELEQTDGEIRISMGVPGRGPDPYMAGRTLEECLAQGVLLGVGGNAGDVLIWRPTQHTTAGQVAAALDILEDCFEELFDP